MSNALEIANHYFELSNASDMDAIEALMTDSTTYSSQSTGVFLGKDQIMTMQRAFHACFQRLDWDVIGVDEVRPGVVLFDFVFTGLRESGEAIVRPGDEYVIVLGDKLQHIEVRNKPSTEL